MTVAYIDMHIVLRDVPVELYGGDYGYFGKNYLPSNLKKIKTLPSSTKICVPLLYGHIFCIGLDLDPYSDIFH